MNLINKTDRMDKQLNEFIYCKVNLFKNDLVSQLRKLIENNEFKIKDENLLELNRRLINKRKFSSSEDEEQDKLDSNSNSNSFESNDKSDNEPLNLNKFLNNWSTKEDKTNNENLECSEKLNSSINNHHTHQSNLNSSDSIEKSFNETFTCLNGLSISLIGNIRLQLNTSTSPQTNSTSLTDNKLDLANDKSNDGKSSEECLNEKDNILTKNDQQKSSTSLNSSPNSFSNNSSNDLNFIKNKLLNSVVNKEIELECKENEVLNNSGNMFKIDRLINDEKRTFSMFSSPFSNNDNKDMNSQLSKEQQLITQQLSASNDSSSSTLSAVSVDTNQPPQQTNFENVAQKSNIRRRSSDDSTASACSEHDCLTPPSRKQFKKENIIDITTVQSPVTTLNNLILSNSFNSLTSSINNQINLDFLPSYLSPSLPQQQKFNELLSPSDQQIKNKKTHLNRSTNSKFNDNKLLSPNNLHQPHKKLNHSPPKQTTNSFTTSSTSNKPTNITNINNNQIHNRKPATENVIDPQMEKILKSYQELAGNSLNGPSSYENLAMLANFHQNYGVNKLDPITARIAKAASAFLHGEGPIPDAQLLMNELTKIKLDGSDDTKSEIASLSVNNLSNYLTKKQELDDTKSTIKRQPKLKIKDNGKLSYTILENERISCFNVGGEPRLCFPQILTTVLRNFSLQDINNVCDQFRIFCSRCNTEQLNMLKAANVLPPGAPSCGLISKSDAERLCAMLFFYANLIPSQVLEKVKNPYLFNVDMDKKETPPESLQPKLKHELKESRFILELIKELPDDIRQLVYEDRTLNHLQKTHALKTTLSFKIEHRCFGKCKGLLIPAFYLRYNSRCILCLECESLLSPNKFICHTHKFNENQTCHWGFDSSNWRNLITLTKKDLNNPKLSILNKYLNEFKFHKIV